MRLSRSLILAAVLMAAAFLATPPTARAAVDCCCDQLRTTCINRTVADCGTLAATPFNVIHSTYTACTQLQSTVQVQTQTVDDSPNPSWLRPILGTELIPPECRVGDAKGCTLSSLLQVLVNITKAMLAVLGSAAFAMFVYGGVVFLTSQGNQERVTTGRRILTNAVLGILVVLVSWTAVNFVVVALSQGRGGFGQMANIFGNQWNRGP
ncbi:MAG: pilin [bacterium]|nr:pilin [bacterium]